MLSVRFGRDLLDCIKNVVPCSSCERSQTVLGMHKAGWDHDGSLSKLLNAKWRNLSDTVYPWHVTKSHWGWVIHELDGASFTLAWIHKPHPNYAHAEQPALKVINLSGFGFSDHHFLAAVKRISQLAEKNNPCSSNKLKHVGRLWVLWKNTSAHTPPNCAHAAGCWMRVWAFQASSLFMLSRRKGKQGRGEKAWLVLQRVYNSITQYLHYCYPLKSIWGLWCN